MDRARLHLLTTRPETWTGGLPSGFPRPIYAGEIHPDSHPRAWRCCHCSGTMPCVPGQDSFFRASEDVWVGPEPCAGCFRARCLECVYLDANGNPLLTVGGKNLRPDWSHPAGWRCCACMSSHMAQVVAQGSIRPPLETHVVTMHFGEERTQGFLEHGCHQRLGGCGHAVCAWCCVVNTYGEVLGTFGSETFQPVSYGPLYAHGRLCHQYHKAVWDIFGAHMRERDDATDPGEWDAADDRAMAWYGRIALPAEGEVTLWRKAVERIQQWVSEFKMAVLGVGQQQGKI